MKKAHAATVPKKTVTYIGKHRGGVYAPDGTPCPYDEPVDLDAALADTLLEEHPDAWQTATSATPTRTTPATPAADPEADA